MPQVSPVQVSARSYNSTALNVSWVPIEQTRERIRGKLIGYRVIIVVLLLGFLQDPYFIWQLLFVPSYSFCAVHVGDQLSRACWYDKWADRNWQLIVVTLNNNPILSSSYYGCTTLYAEFWPSQPIPSIFFNPGQGSFNLALLTSVYLFESSSQRIFGLPIGLLEMGFQQYIALTILVSCILSMWPSHPSLCALMKFILFLCFIIPVLHI